MRGWTRRRAAKGRRRQARTAARRCTIGRKKIHSAGASGGDARTHGHVDMAQKDTCANMAPRSERRAAGAHSAAIGKRATVRVVVQTESCSALVVALRALLALHRLRTRPIDTQLAMRSIAFNTYLRESPPPSAAFCQPSPPFSFCLISVDRIPLLAHNHVRTCDRFNNSQMHSIFHKHVAHMQHPPLPSPLVRHTLAKSQFTLRPPTAVLSFKLPPTTPPLRVTNSSLANRHCTIALIEPPSHSRLCFPLTLSMQHLLRA